MKHALNYTYTLKQFALYGLFLLFAVSCKKDQDQFDPRLILEVEESLSVTNAEMEHQVDLLSNQIWMAESDVPWITFPEDGGEKGKSVLTFHVSKNEDDERSGTITVSTSGGVQQQFTVVQEAGTILIFYVKSDGTGEGRSWSDAANLSDALKEATSGSIINIAAGTYAPTETVTGGDAADEGDKTFEINKHIVLKGGFPEDASGDDVSDPTTHTTLLTGKLESGSESYHVVTVSAPKTEGQKVVIEGVTISNGNAYNRGSKVNIAGTEFSRGNGAGMIIGNSNVDLIDVSIVDNKTTNIGDVGYAPGLFIFGGSEVTMTRCKMNRNESAGNGGGLWVDRSTAYIYDSQFNENSGGTAPAVHGYPDSKIYMYNSEIANNKGRSYGAALYLRSNSKGVLVNCLIYGNTSTSKNGGGGIMLYDDCEVDVISSTITQNKIGGPGGGIYRRLNTNRVNVYNSIISGNEQVKGSSDVDAFEEDIPAPVLRSSVVSNMVYGTTGEGLEGTVFDFNTMLNAMLKPIGDGNPALLFGMSANELTKLGAEYDPDLEQFISSDKNNRSRSGSTTMGALVE